MIKVVEVRVSRLFKRTKSVLDRLMKRFFLYLRRLFFPIYLFPIKLITYSVYYCLRFLIKTVVAFFKIIIDCIIFPFRSLKNFLKSVFIVALLIYIAASIFVIMDYLTTQYGYVGKFLCSFNTREKLQRSVVRVVGGYSEGSGFFVTENQIITNFHVIADEPSPKVILPDSNFLTPTKIVGNKDVDLAILYTKDTYWEYVLPLPDNIMLFPDEPVMAVGYPLGTSLTGRATISKGRFIDFRKSKQMPVAYTQTDISLVEGMSGGPMTDMCGNVVGINTLGLAGLSLFINGDWAKNLIPDFTDQGIVKIEVDPSLSPEDAVRAFYTYLKARKMEDGFGLLSKEYLQKTDFTEWTSRFKDILDVNIFISRRHLNTEDTAFVKFGTKNWVNGEVEIHLYEGTWQTVMEDGVYKMVKSKIVEVDNPEMDWFYD